MPSETTAALNERVSQIMRANIVHAALLHRGEDFFRSIDPISAAVFENRGLLVATGTTNKDELFAILTNPGHPRRIAAPPGPMLFYKDGGTSVSVFSPADLLANSDPDVRLGA